MMCIGSLDKNRDRIFAYHMLLTFILIFMYMYFTDIFFTHQVNGALTKGENFRDTLALQIAYDVSMNGIYLFLYIYNFNNFINGTKPEMGVYNVTASRDRFAPA